MSRKTLLRYILLIVFLVVLDQNIKAMVEIRMDLHERYDLLPFLSLLHARNTGIAFSFLSGLDSGWLSLLAVAIIGLMAWLGLRTEPHQIYARLSFALIIAGAIGNLIDRVLNGYVVDYIYFHTPVWSFAVFNFADVLITVGAGLLILEEFLTWRRSRKTGQ